MGSPVARSLFALLASSTLVGCAPLPGVYFAETPEALQKKAMSITAAGGGGGAMNYLRASTGDGGTTSRSKVAAGGGAARLRVGVGGHQEIGVEVMGAIVKGDSDPDDAVGVLDPMTPKLQAWGAKASWKWAPNGIVAILAGLGYSNLSTETAPGTKIGSLGGDLALLLGPKLPVVPLRLYGGVRVGLAGPIHMENVFGPEPKLMLSGAVPIGLSFELLILRVFVEGGVLASREWTSNQWGNVQVTGTSVFYDTIGGYALVGVGLYLGGTE